MNLTEALKITQALDERALTFNGQVAPKYGTVIILAGGAGSGKGAVLKNLVGKIDGDTVFDVDSYKELFDKSPNNPNTKAQDKLRDMIINNYVKNTGRDLTQDELDLINNFDMANGQHVSKLHAFIKKSGINDKLKDRFLQSAKNTGNEHLPNITFDCTLKDTSTIEKDVKKLLSVGYTPQNVHVVWVLNSLENAQINNLARKRKLPPTMVQDIHKEVSTTFKKEILGGIHKDIIDGDIYIVFNEFADSIKGLTSDSNYQKALQNSGGVKNRKDWQFEFNSKGFRKGFIADYVQLKKAGKAFDWKTVDNAILDRIKELVPNGFEWE